MLRFVHRENDQEKSEKIKGMPDWLSEILLARGVKNEEEAKKFLYPDKKDLLSPQRLPGIWEVVKILRELANTHEKIAVYGDYDVDGVCGAAILKEALEKAGLRPFVYIPDRHEEGYGLNLQAVEKLSRECHAMITVDCGITSVKEVELAKELGMTVLVTDHHHPGDELPHAHGLVNPQVGDYPFPYLCGAGVAWKISRILCGEEFAQGQLDICALATVADLVPLLGENRVLVTLGLEELKHSKRPGIQALCHTAGLEQKKITSESVAYQLAPRLNAAGRLESAMESYELLTCKDRMRSQELAMRLEKVNQQRKDAQKEVVEASEKEVLKMDLTSLFAIVVLGENWDSGVVGLSAGKIAEKYAYPTVVLTKSEDGTTCVGSARSACGVDLYTALKNCGDIFLRFGGHSQAAGMTLLCENVPLLRERLSEQVKLQLKGQVPVREVFYDGSMTLREMTRETVENMALLEPFGMGNPAPRFLIENVEGVVMRGVGASLSHLKCTFRQDGTLRDGIFFGGGAWADMPKGVSLFVVGVPDINVFNGRETVQCQVKALKMDAKTLPDDEDEELRIFLQDLTHWTENIQISSPYSTENFWKEGDEIPPDWMEKNQGTLLWCRKAATARKWYEKYPEGAFMVKDASDPRCYTGIGVHLEKIGERYKRIVLCDGVSCPQEKAYLLKTCPQVQWFSLRKTESREILEKLRMSADELRNLYKVLRTQAVCRLDDLAERENIPFARILCAAKVLSQMKLIDLKVSPPQTLLLAPHRCDPKDSEIFRILWQTNLEEGG